jgi:thiamine-phosphate pyrophosphorylase
VSFSVPVRPALPPLYPILDTAVARQHGWAPVDLARAYFEGGARWVQLRAKTESGREMLAMAEALVRIAAPSGGVVIVNDRADIARLAGAAGVHVGQDDLPVAAVRRLGGSLIIGVSTHTEAQIAEAATASPTYVAVGPIFVTATKDTGYPAAGVELVRRASGTLRLPIVAIGGITLDRAPDLLAAGAASVAVIGDLLAAGDPAARVRTYLERLHV